LTVSEVTLAAIRKAYQVWTDSRGEDVGPLIDLMHDQVQLTTLADGASPLEFSKPCYSKADLACYFDGLLGDWDLLGTEIEEVVCEHDYVVVLLDTSWRNRRTDKRFDSPAAHAWRFRDGKATHVRLFFDSAKWAKAARPD